MALLRKWHAPSAGHSLKPLLPRCHAAQASTSLVVPSCPSCPSCLALVTQASLRLRLGPALLALPARLCRGLPGSKDPLTGAQGVNAGQAVSHTCLCQRGDWPQERWWVPQSGWARAASKSRLNLGRLQGRSGTESRERCFLANRSWAAGAARVSKRRTRPHRANNSRRPTPDPELP